MKLKFIKEEDFINYKKPSMFIGFPSCTFKCGSEICQNSPLTQQPDIEVTVENIIELYLNNSITTAVVCGGLEPFDSFQDLINLIEKLRKVSEDDIVIYTGYYSYEILDKLKSLSRFNNIFIKFGRYIPDQDPHFDKTLGVKLASDNQFAVKLNKYSIEIIDALESNGGYCPCALEKSDDTLCSCKEFREGDEGECHCGLYKKII